VRFASADFAGEGSLVSMERLRDGTVYLCLDYDFFDEMVTHGNWTGHCEFFDDSPPEFGPEFADANDAVLWWRARGAKSIYVRLDQHEYLWAGDGPRPESDEAMPSFDAADPRGRPEGAALTIETERAAFAQTAEAERVSIGVDEGHRLLRRREAMGLSIKELARRVDKSAGWLADVESGATTHDVTMSEWVSLVWATRPGWPDEMNGANSGRYGWTARPGTFLREAEVIVDRHLGLDD
jgi:hypothetical protein